MTLQQKLTQADDYLDMLKDKAKETDELAKENLQLRNKFDRAINELRKSDRKIERLKERLDIAQTAYLSVNEKNSKAIEYIENNTYKSNATEYMDLTGISELLDILKGADKE